MKKIFLKTKKEASLQRFHPWVFSGAIDRMDGQPADGETVEVYSKSGEYLATGHFQDSSICVRIFSFEPTDSRQDFWSDKLRQAYQYRQELGLVNHPQTNAYRLVHAEGDGLPGLIIDIYNRTAVIQCHSIGMHLEMGKIVQGLQSIYGDHLEAIYDKSEETLPAQYASTISNGYRLGSPQHPIATEYGHSFLMDWESGQKTGFFLDQRENRRIFASYAAGKQVLNTFCYTGGFSVYALKAGASHVDSIDSSARAIELTQKNVSLNGNFAPRHRALTMDVLRFLKEHENQYDLMVVDPPAFAKNVSKRHNAVQGYKRLNALAFRRIRKGGVLFTFSCSQVVDKVLFYHTIVAAALEAGRKVKIMHELSQPADHPVSLFHPEGAYLKGLALYVDQ